MRRYAFHILLIVILLLQGGLLLGQNHVRDAMRRARLQQEALAARNMDRVRSGIQTGGYLSFSVENGDTTYYDTIDPVWVFAKGLKSKKKDWRKYYRLVYNFARVYPYAIAAGRLDDVADSTIQAQKMNRRAKDKYVAGLQKDLFADFGGALRGMTISQGALLLKLIDRESGKTSYDIIKEYKSGIAAGFWNGIAKMFDNTLKAGYDAEGADKDTEELIQKWNDGTFPALYYSIFFESPPEVYVPDKYK